MPPIHPSKNLWTGSLASLTMLFLSQSTDNHSLPFVLSADICSNTSKPASSKETTTQQFALWELNLWSGSQFERDRESSSLRLLVSFISLHRLLHFFFFVIQRKILANWDLETLQLIEVSKIVPKFLQGLGWLSSTFSSFHCPRDHVHIPFAVLSVRVHVQHDLTAQCKTINNINLTLNASQKKLVCDVISSNINLCQARNMPSVQGWGQTFVRKTFWQFETEELSRFVWAFFFFWSSPELRTRNLCCNPQLAQIASKLPSQEWSRTVKTNLFGKIL